MFTGEREGGRRGERLHNSACIYYQISYVLFTCLSCRLYYKVLVFLLKNLEAEMRLSLAGWAAAGHCGLGEEGGRAGWIGRPTQLGDKMESQRHGVPR